MLESQGSRAGEAVPMLIGELARRAGVNVQTVRYYELRGLLAEPTRTLGGYRQYTEDALDRMRFIRRAQDLGFTLSEIADLLALKLDPRTPADAVRRRAHAKIANIDRRVRGLERMRHALVGLAEDCRGPIDACPLLGTLGAPGSDA